MTKRVKKTRRSRYLTGIAADNLRAATEFAAERGTPINCAISINWTMFSGFGVPDDVRLARAQERLRHRLERRNRPWRVKAVTAIRRDRIKKIIVLAALAFAFVAGTAAVVYPQHALADCGGSNC
jgi:hypothetical protein